MVTLEMLFLKDINENPKFVFIHFYDCRNKGDDNLSFLTDLVILSSILLS